MRRFSNKLPELAPWAKGAAPFVPFVAVTARICNDFFSRRRASRYPHPHDEGAYNGPALREYRGAANLQREPRIKLASFSS